MQRYSQIPELLRAQRQWLNWKYEDRGGKRTKVPYCSRTGRKADTTDPLTWSTFEDAVEALGERADYAGIGYVFNGDTWGFDEDNVHDPATGVIDPEALRILQSLATYTELSPSERGIHAIGIGELPGAGKRRGSFELYGRGRFFTMTGRRLDAFPGALAHPNGALTDLWAYLSKEADRALVAPIPNIGESTLSDDEVIERAEGASNGAKFLLLWSGSTQGYTSQSEATQALCLMLAFWCRCDAEQMDRLYQRSGQSQDKWGERRGGSTYGHNEIRSAIAHTSAVYEGGNTAQLVVISNGHKVNAETGEVLEEGEEQETPEEKPKPPSKDLLDAGRRWYVLYHEEWSYDAQLHLWHHWTGTYHKAEQRPSIKLDNQAMRVLRQIKLTVSSSSRIDGTIRAAAALSARTFEPPAGHINFVNGTLDPATWELQDHDPAHGFTYCLGYPWQAGDYPTIARFLGQTIPDPDGVQAYMIHLGLALLNDMRLHKTLILIGPPRSGKSTVLALSNAVCGQDPYGNAGPELFSRETEGLRSRASWNGRRIVTLEELPVEALRNEEIIKAMVAHGGVPMRHLWQREAMENRWRPKVLMATNERPRYSDRTGALTKRIIPISCPNARPETDINPFLLDQLLPELAGFAAACVSLAAVTLESGGVYPMSDAMRDLLAEIEQQGDSLKSWVRDRCVLEADAWERTDVLYSDYKRYCEMNGNKVMSKERFAMSVCERYASVAATRARIKGSSTAQRGLGGLYLTPVEVGDNATF